jgi:hypothetical protein
MESHQIKSNLLLTIQETKVQVKGLGLTFLSRILQTLMTFLQMKELILLKKYTIIISTRCRRKLKIRGKKSLIRLAHRAVTIIQTKRKIKTFWVQLTLLSLKFPLTQMKTALRINSYKVKRVRTVLTERTWRTDTNKRCTSWLTILTCPTSLWLYLLLVNHLGKVVVQEATWVIWIQVVSQIPNL